MSATAVADLLDRTTSFFESVLWETEAGARMREHLARSGVEERLLRSFRVGYAPGDTRRLLDNVDGWGHSRHELITAGLATRSDRSRVHVLFHGRITFPICDADGDVLGFAALATHLGPSWPLWLTSPDQGRFEASSVLYGLEHAAGPIADAKRALVLRDPIQVLAMHGEARRDAVAVIHSPITRKHTSRLAALIGSGDLDYVRRDGRLGVVAVPAGAGPQVGEEDFAPPTLPAGISLIDSKAVRDRRLGARDQASFDDTEFRPSTRPIVYLAGACIGIGIPLGILALAAPHNEAAEGSTPTLNITIAGIAVAYFVLALIVGRISARVRAGSKARRMREPWARGMGEWQPRGWTYHHAEEILVGAALLSAITCLVLWMTIGGFLG